MSAPRGADLGLTSLVLPAYNPGTFLDHTCREIQRFLREAPGAWEILFVCDGCRDDSPARLQDWARGQGERVRVIAYAPNRGKGYAVRRGLMEARGRWRLFTDVDLAYRFEDILRVAETLRHGADVAIGSRVHPRSQVLAPANLLGYAYRRHVQSTAFSALVRLLLPLTQKDTQAGLKGMSAQAARVVLPRLTCNGFGFDCELLTACVRQRLTVAEVPVCVRLTDAGTTTGLRAMGRMVSDLWRIRRAWRAQLPTASSLTPPRDLREAA